MRLQLQSDKGVTLVENIFIDQYMPAANGEFVKLYIYLLRCAGAGRDLSVSSIADFFDHTEKDVKRALTYWAKQGLLTLEYGPDKKLAGIIFADLSASGQTSAETHPAVSAARQASPAIPQTSPAVPGISEPVPQVSVDVPVMTAAAADVTAAAVSAVSAPAAAKTAELPSRHSLSPARRRKLQEQEEIRQLIFVAETIFKRPLSSTEVGNLLYFYDGLGFSCELIEYLIEYCAGKGDPGTRYMEKIATDWYTNGIQTVAQAKEDSHQFNGLYYQILGFLGIKNRSPIEKETKYMDRWINDWNFSSEMIREACSRTVMQTAQPSIQYADSILKSWHEAKAMTLADVSALDEAHAQKQSAASKNTVSIGQSAASRTASRSDSSRINAKNRFNNFQQREYDFASLEQQLLQAQARKEG